LNLGLQTHELNRGLFISCVAARLFGTGLEQIWNQEGFALSQGDAGLQAMP
jgi:hypothetical protein